MNPREIELKGSASAQFAVDPNISTALLHDSVDTRQTQASSLARFLRCEEWLKDPRFGRFVHAASGVPHRQHDVFARHNRLMPTTIVLVEIDAGSFDGYLTTIGHRISRI